MKILVLDGYRDAADSLARVLELGGHRVEVHYGSTSAAASRLDPDLVILGTVLEEGDAWVYVGALHRSTAPRRPGVALLSAAPPGDEARQAGVDWYLRKPADPAQVRSLVAAYADCLRRGLDDALDETGWGFRSRRVPASLRS